MLSYNQLSLDQKKKLNGLLSQFLEQIGANGKFHVQTDSSFLSLYRSMSNPPDEKQKTQLNAFLEYLQKTGAIRFDVIMGEISRDRQTATTQIYSISFIEEALLQLEPDNVKQLIDDFLNPAAHPYTASAILMNFLKDTFLPEKAVIEIDLREPGSEQNQKLTRLIGHLKEKHLLDYTIFSSPFPTMHIHSIHPLLAIVLRENKDNVAIFSLLKQFAYTTPSTVTSAQKPTAEISAQQATTVASVPEAARSMSKAPSKQSSKEVLETEVLEALKVLQVFLTAMHNDIQTSLIKDTKSKKDRLMITIPAPNSKKGKNLLGAINFLKEQALLVSKKTSATPYTIVIYPIYSRPLITLLKEQKFITMPSNPVAMAAPSAPVTEQKPSVFSEKEINLDEYLNTILEKKPSSKTILEPTAARPMTASPATAMPMTEQQERMELITRFNQANPDVHSKQPSASSSEKKQQKSGIAPPLQSSTTSSVAPTAAKPTMATAQSPVQQSARVSSLPQNVSTQQQPIVVVNQPQPVRPQQSSSSSSAATQTPSSPMASLAPTATMPAQEEEKRRELDELRQQIQREQERIALQQLIQQEKERIQREQERIALQQLIQREKERIALQEQIAQLRQSQQRAQPLPSSSYATAQPTTQTVQHWPNPTSSSLLTPPVSLPPQTQPTYYQQPSSSSYATAQPTARTEQHWASPTSSSLFAPPVPLQSQVAPSQSQVLPSQQSARIQELALQIAQLEADRQNRQNRK